MDKVGKNYYSKMKMFESITNWKNSKIRISNGWEGFGQSGIALGDPVWIGQYWLPVLWDNEEDPNWHKLEGIDILINYKNNNQ